MLEEPFVEFWVRVVVGVGIVSYSGISGELGVSLGCLNGVDHFPGLLD